MNATSLHDAPQTTLADMPVPSSLTFTVMLPYFALALTLAAYQLRVPARLAALTRDSGASHSTSTSYPVPTPRS